LRPNSLHYKRYDAPAAILGMGYDPWTIVMATDCSIGQRIAVVGTSGSGKTTLAAGLAQRLGFPHVELDALHWEPDWTEAPFSTFRDRVQQAVDGKAWVVDGNYSAVRDIVWSRADTVVWLDYGLPTILKRLLWRTFRRIFTRETLWSGNRERFWTQIATRESIFLWALKTYRRRRREYPALLAKSEYRHLNLVRLHSPRQAYRFLITLQGRLVSPSG
jgi:adenylate kinase family enzyme